MMQFSRNLTMALCFMRYPQGFFADDTVFFAFMFSSFSVSLALDWLLVFASFLPHLLSRWASEQIRGRIILPVILSAVHFEMRRFLQDDTKKQK